jgi:hypothetical protein
MVHYGEQTPKQSNTQGKQPPEVGGDDNAALLDLWPDPH